MRFACLVLLSICATVHAKGLGLILNTFLGALFTDMSDGAQDEMFEQNVTFYLYTREHPDQAVELHENTISQVNKRHPTKFIVHGWLESANRPWYKDMTQEYFKKGDYNIIQVDWSVPASKNYHTSAANTRPVGAIIGKLIVTLYINYGIPLSSFHVIGHSLGAHVSGFAGKEVFKLTRSKIPRITALDAAGPLFEIPRLFNLEGLRETDAIIVDAVHTDAGVFGYERPLATVDFYPNGGIAIQPGCTLLPNMTSVLNIQSYLDNIFCSHTRSYIYFIRSINEEKFGGTKCRSWNRFKSGKCDENLKVLMGNDYSYNPGATGTFYLRTDQNS